MKKLIYLLVVVLAAVTMPLSAVEFPEVEGWSRDSGVISYDPEKLWEYINGAAEVFIQFGFEQLKTCELSVEGLTVTVGIYDMGTGLNAFGMFRTELPADASLLDIGAGALVSAPYQCLLLKDRYYIKVDAFKGEINQENGEALLHALAAALPGNSGLPEEIQSLPEENLIPGSQRYQREVYQGLRELKGCVYAKYNDESGASYQVFRMLPPPGKTADAVWQELAGKWTKVDHETGPVLAKMVPYRGITAVTKTDDGIIGVTDCKTKDIALARLSEIVK
jgi:hypothetical protein